MLDGRLHRDPIKDDDLDVIAWWERRRLFYNLVVGCTGLVTCFLMISCGVIAEPLVGEAIGIPNPPILVPLSAVAYGVLANICYTGGWIAELLTRRLRPWAYTPSLGVRLFRLGVKFSIGVTLFPAVLCWAMLLFSFATGQRARGWA
jgi:hypothetical protein